MNEYIIYTVAALCLLNTAALAYLFILFFWQKNHTTESIEPDEGKDGVL